MPVSSCSCVSVRPRRDLVTYTWGNVSGIDRESGLVVIKPSGVEYNELTPENLVVLDLDGNRVEGDLNPSSDTKIHLELYKAFPMLGGHRPYPQPLCGSLGPGGQGYSLLRNHPCRLFLRRRALRPPPDEEGTGRGLRKNTGKIIIETFKGRDIDPVAVPSIICHSHGPFT